MPTTSTSSSIPLAVQVSAWYSWYPYIGRLDKNIQSPIGCFCHWMFLTETLDVSDRSNVSVRNLQSPIGS
eukprot:2246132-Rhodomonas_salina.1